MAQLSDLKKSYQQLSTEERMALTMAIRLSRRTTKARINGKKSATVRTPRVSKKAQSTTELFANMTPEQLAAILAALGGDE